MSTSKRYEIGWVVNGPALCYVPVPFQHEIQTDHERSPLPVPQAEIPAPAREIRPPRSARPAPELRDRHHDPLRLAPGRRSLTQRQADDSPAPGDGELRPTPERGAGAPCRSNLRSSGRTRSTGFSSPMRSTRASTLEADPLPSPSVDTLSGTRVVLALDQITDPHNVGAIVRTAAAFDVEAIITTARHSPAATGVLAKSASGGLEHVPFMIVRNLGDTLTALGERGFQRIGLDSIGRGESGRVPITPARRPRAGLGGQGPAPEDPGLLRRDRPARHARGHQEPERLQCRRDQPLCCG